MPVSVVECEGEQAVQPADEIGPVRANLIAAEQQTSRHRKS
jgi:hypothetical protein